MHAVPAIIILNSHVLYRVFRVFRFHSRSRSLKRPGI